MSSQVVIYRHVNFEGASQALNIGNYDMIDLAIGNDTVSSLRVPPGLKVTLYQNAGFRGGSKVFTQDTAWVGLDFNDRTSSLKVETILTPVYQYRAETPVWRYFYSTDSIAQEGWIQDGIAFFALHENEATVPVYRFVAPTPYYRYQYSTYPAVNGPGWLNEGIAFHAFKEQRPDTIAVYQYAAVTDNARRCLYSTAPGIQDGWTNEGPVFYVAAIQS